MPPEKAGRARACALRMKRVQDGFLENRESFTNQSALILCDQDQQIPCLCDAPGPGRDQARLQALDHGLEGPGLAPPAPGAALLAEVTNPAEEGVPGHGGARNRSGEEGGGTPAAVLSGPLWSPPPWPRHLRRQLVYYPISSANRGGKTGTLTGRQGFPLVRLPASPPRTGRR